MPRERVAPQSEVIRAIILGYSPCCEVPAPTHRPNRLQQPRCHGERRQRKPANGGEGQWKQVPQQGICATRAPKINTHRPGCFA